VDSPLKVVFHILLVEDNPGDVRLAREALSTSRSPTNLMVAEDGEEAMAMLRDPQQYGRPDLIILDLNLPRKDGREVLAEIKSDTDLRCIPVVILTTSKAEQDAASAYNLQANCYITKAVNWDRACEIVQRIDEFWLRTATLPRKVS
jgi:two-component system, chemotaxis family, response regulator Rcp1